MRISLVFLFCCTIFLAGCTGGTSNEDKAREGMESMQEEIDRLRLESEAMDPVRIRQREVRDSLCRELCVRLTAYSFSLNGLDSTLEAGADPNCDCAIQHSQKRFGARIPIVKDFMRRKYNTWETQKPALTMVVANGNAEAVRSLLKLGADPNRQIDSTGLALDEALAQDDGKIIDLLLKAEADPKLVDLGNAKSEHLVDRFVSLGADPSNIDFDPAIRACDKRLVRKYFKLGARPERVDHFFLVNFCGREGLLQTMLEMGLDPDVPGKRGKGSLLAEATKSGSERQMKMLLEAGADPDLFDFHDRCPLRIAIERNRPKKVDLLLEAGAEVNPVNEGKGYSKNLMEAAIMKGNVEVVRKMQGKGARVSAEHGSNLDYAQNNGANEDIQEVLK